MCDDLGFDIGSSDMTGGKAIPVADAVGAVLAHDITEIRPGEFKGRAFKKGHIIRQEDVCHLRRLGKERLFILEIAPDEMHEDEAAHILAAALMGEGVTIEGGPIEGKINIIAARDGLLKVDKEALLAFNMLGDVMCAALHDNTLVKKGRVVAGTRAIPLVIKRKTVLDAVSAVSSSAVIEVKQLRKPRAGVVITGSEVYHGKIKDAFAPVIRKKVEEFGGEIVGLYYAPDDVAYITKRLEELIEAGVDLLVTTGGMSVDPDDVTRFAIRQIGAKDITYGSAVLPGAMFLVANLERNGRTIPVLGIPACGMYHNITIFDLIFPRILAEEKIGRRELAELGHGGLCLHCKECRYPECPFGK
ncbi:MAG: molybdopterin-binding protein [Actinomycetota bacterium]|nr:molybdopterin-binding protein [Actinomycetota bacterium]